MKYPIGTWFRVPDGTPAYAAGERYDKVVDFESEVEKSVVTNTLIMEVYDEDGNLMRVMELSQKFVDRALEEGLLDENEGAPEVVN